MQLSKKQKVFSDFFAAFLKSKSNFEDFEKIDESHSLCISEIMDCERRGYLNILQLVSRETSCLLSVKK